MPNHADAGVERIHEFQEAAQEAGRPGLPVIVMGPPTDEDVLGAYAEAGVQRVLFWLPSGRRAIVEAKLDEVERVMAEVNPVN